MTMDIKEWVAVEPVLRKCARCEKGFPLGSGYVNGEHYGYRFVCSWRCAELFTDDHNAGEAEAKVER